MAKDISQVTPDFDDLEVRFQNEMRATDSLQDLVTAALGKMLSSALAEIGAETQFAVAQAFRETHSDTARLDSSHLTIARTLGVHIQRRIPASVSATLTRNTTTPLNIGRYSQFSVGGTRFFNRNEIVFSTNETSKAVTLYEGVLYSEAFISNGLPNQVFELGNVPFAVSDQDVLCFVNSTNEFSSTTVPLFQYTSTSKVFYENTTSDGKVKCVFGNGAYGVIPDPSATVAFVYALTNGESANRPTSSEDVTISSFPEISGTTTSAIANGTAEKPASFYKYTVGHLGASKDRALTKEEHSAIALTYPGVKDALFRGQWELNPNNVTFMNAISATLLTDTTWTNQQWKDFVAWFQKKAIATTYLVRTDPVPITINVDVTVYAFEAASLTDVQSAVTQKITDLFAPTLGSIGRQFFVSDLTAAIMSVTYAGSQPAIVDYINLTTPKKNYDIGPQQYMKLGTLTVGAVYSTRNSSNL